jgi:hypothetical protein
MDAELDALRDSARRCFLSRICGGANEVMKEIIARSMEG